MKSLPTCIYSASSLSFTTRIVFLCNWCTNIDKHYYTKFIVRTGFTFSIVNAVGFNKFIRTYTYHDNSTKNNFTALKILMCSTYSHFPNLGKQSFFKTVSTVLLFPDSPIIASTVWNFPLSWFLSISKKHLGFYQVFSFLFSTK